jgi:hypothetical protein
MAFKTLKTATVSLESPESLFHDLRGRKIPGLLSQQADLLRKYISEAVEKPDVALQLATGSGKTLVGLLIAEWRRLKFQERVVYLCPTNQLVHQVANMAVNQYGLKVDGFVGKKAEYDPAKKGEYLGAEAVAITSYSSLFNIRPFFENPNVIILDDAHSAENYVSKMWSLQINRKDHEAAYKAAASVFLDLLTFSDQQRLTGHASSAWDNNWVEKIPSPAFTERLPELIQVLNTHLAETELSYCWGLVRDHLHGCHCYLDPREMLIRPLIPPTFSHTPFSDAKQRIYMSATLGEGGDLERVTGRPKIVRLKVDGWEKQGIGRRFFLFPQRSLNDEQTEKFIFRVLQEAGRSLVIVPDDLSAKEYRAAVQKTLGFATFDARDIELSKEPFLQQQKAVAVVANRYDGIDFPDDQCRVLVVAGLPRATNAQEKFFITRLGAVALLNDRILTRIVQAFGRCTRSATDFAAVVIEGEELHTYLLASDRRQFLHPELQAELQFGIDNSKEETTEGFMENLRAFLQQTDEWRHADSQIVQIRQSTSRKQLPGTEDLQAAVDHEIAYQAAMWNGDFGGAFDACRSVLGRLKDSSLKGYRALWSYLAGSAAWLAHRGGHSGMDQNARTHYANAQKAAPGVSWLVRLSRLEKVAETPSDRDNAALCSQVERLEQRLESLGTVHDRRYDEEEKLIAENIAEKDSTKFELAHEHLGNLLGFSAGKEEGTGTPDPWWFLHDELCLVFEDHSNAMSTSTLDVTKARQVATHPNWVRERFKLDEKAIIIPVLVTPVAKVDHDALPHLKDVYVWQIDEFREWAKTALRVIREIRREFPGTGDLAWRAIAAEKLQKAGLDGNSIAGALVLRTAEKVLSAT